MPLIYDELRKLAAQKLAQEKPGQILQATALVHEAYLQLVSQESEGQARENWNSRGHFFAAAAEAMRRILVEQARRKRRVKHGGGRVVKVIEFGVAKSIGQQLTDKTVYTQFVQLVGTPLYMSPGQAGGERLGRGHAERYLFPRRASLRTADRHHAV